MCIMVKPFRWHACHCTFNFSPECTPFYKLVNVFQNREPSDGSGWLWWITQEEMSQEADSHSPPRKQLCKCTDCRNWFLYNRVLPRHGEALMWALHKLHCAGLNSPVVKSAVFLLSLYFRLIGVALTDINTVWKHSSGHFAVVERGISEPGISIQICWR